MAPSSSNYIGVEMDEVDQKNLHLRTRTQSTDASLYSPSSDISLLKHNPRERPKRTFGGASQRAKQLLEKPFWITQIAHAKTAFRNAWADAKAVSWGRTIWRIFVFTGPLAWLVGLSLILAVTQDPTHFETDQACRPDSGFYVGYDEYNIWAASGFFQITLGFGEFSFTNAKIIDVAWDVVVGRGGQAILALISYYVFTKALVRSMESSPVTYGTFEAITLQDNTVFGVYKLTRDLFKNRTVRGKLVVFWIVLSALFTLAFPTLSSAMTGYFANIQSYITNDDGSMTPYSDFSVIRYIIHDASRLDTGLEDDHIIKGSRRAGHSDVVSLDYIYSVDFCYSQSPYPNYDEDGTYDWGNLDGETSCDLYWHVSEYAAIYGMAGVNQTNSTFNASGMIVELPPPSLNISGFFWTDQFQIDDDEYSRALWYSYPYGQSWKDANGNLPFNVSDPTFADSTNQQYSLAEINARGRCQQDDSSYKWGFSFLILFSVLVTFLVWSLGVYCLWIDAWLHSRFDRAGRKMGLHRAVLDLSYCIHKDMGEQDNEMLSSRELRTKIQRGLNGGRITYEMLDASVLPLSRYTALKLWWHDFSFKQWAKDEWVYLFCYVCTFAYMIASLLGVPGPLYSNLALNIGFFLVLVAGREARSRWIFLFIAIVLAIIGAPFGSFWCNGYQCYHWYY